MFGNPGGGKSWAVIDILAYAAFLGYNVVYYTLELSEAYVGKRMDAYLTNDARSIPKLIALDAKTLQEIGIWGPRPQVAMDLFYELRKQGMEKSLQMETLQRWYLADKNQSIQIEFEKLLDEWAIETAKSFEFAL